MKCTFYALFLIIVCSCNFNDEGKNKNTNRNNIEKLSKQLAHSESDKILVVSHRGDWRNAPENSLQAIQNCIDMGVDIVEIDVRKTKDNQLVIIHDTTLDRTTTGSGLVSEWNLDSLKKLSLKNGLGIPTNHKIPTLKEALKLSKNKILLNLDKSYDYFDEVFVILKETSTIKQVLLKGSVNTVKKVQEDLGPNFDTVFFMPVINLDKQKNAVSLIKEIQDKLKPVAIELVFNKDTSSVLDHISDIKRNGSRVWVNSLCASLNAGYEDDAALKNSDSIYGWYVKKGINIIQTDRPELLLNFLKSKNLHN